MKKRFIVRKYIWAENARQALTLEKNHEVEDLMIDEDWKKESEWNKEPSAGFRSDLQKTNKEKSMATKAKPAAKKAAPAKKIMKAAPKKK